MVRNDIIVVECCSMAHKDLLDYEVTCVVSCQHKASADDIWTSSAIFVSPQLILAPGSILQSSPSEVLPLDIKGNFKFRVLTYSNEGAFITTEANLITSWKCHKLATIVDKLFLHDIQHGPDKSSEDALAVDLITRFLLLEVPESYMSTKFLSFKTIGESYQGAKLLTCSTPFGWNDNVKCFYNSWCSGIASKEIGRHIFLSDVACAPGAQGGLAYFEDTMVPVGIVLYPAVEKCGSLTGLSIIASLSAVLDSLQAHLSDEKITYPQIVIPSSSLVVPITRYSRVVRVRTSNLWGSGILLSGAYVLTCSHVVNRTPTDVFHIEWHDKKLTAILVYKSDSLETFDVAILKLSTYLDGIEILPPVQQATTGTAIMAEGYGLFRFGNAPMVSSGIIAKVHSVGGYSYNLVTTCQVHPGSSGGPIIDKNGKVIAMILANMYDFTTQMEYTNISLAFSLNVLYPAIANLYKTADAGYFKYLEKQFNNLDSKDKAVQSKL